MARSGGGGSRRSAPAPARQAPPPAPRAAAPPPAAAPAPHMPAAAAPQQSAGGGFLSTMVQGFAFGTGSAVAREAVHSVMGGSSSSNSQQQQAPASAPMQQQPMAQGPCSIDQEQLMSCLRVNSSNAGACDFYMNALQQCQSMSSGRD